MNFLTKINEDEDETKIKALQTKGVRGL